MTISRRVGVLTIAVALVAMLLAVSPGAGAQEAGNQTGVADNDVVFSTQGEVLDHVRVAETFDGQFQPYIVPAAAFTSDGFDPDSHFFNFFGGFIKGTDAAYGCMVAPVQLPDGATVVNLFGYLYDNDDTRDVELALRRQPNSTTASGETMASVSTTGDFTHVQIPGDTTVINEVVNNSSYSYYLTVCVGSELTQLHAAWIFVEPADDTLAVYGLEAKIEVTPTGGEANRILLSLVNRGKTSFELEDVAQGASWLFGTKGSGFEVNLAGSGGSEFRFLDNGRVLMGPGPAINFDLSPTGNLEIAGSLTQNSDEADKTAIRTVDPEAVLAAVEDLEISTWQYLSDPVGTRHLGPMAQDFHAAFGLAGTDTGISPLDTSGVALASIQALADRNTQLEARIVELEAVVAALLDE